MKIGETRKRGEKGKIGARVGSVVSPVLLKRINKL
jgi:hypothetical protein